MTGTREPEEAEMLRIRLIRHLVTWSLGLFFAAQALVISILLGIDAQN